MDTIQNIKREIDILEDKASKLQAKAHANQAPTDERAGKMLEYSIKVLASDIERTCLLELDSVLSEGNEEIRLARREQVLRAKKLIDRCDTIRAGLLAFVQDHRPPVSSRELRGTKANCHQEDQEHLHFQTIPLETSPQDKAEDDNICGKDSKKLKNEEGGEHNDHGQVNEEKVNEGEAAEQETESALEQEEEEDNANDFEESYYEELDQDPTRWLVDFSEQEKRDQAIDLVAHVGGALMHSISVTSSGDGSLRVRAFKPVSQCRGNYQVGSFGQLDRTFNFPADYDVTRSRWSVDNRTGTLVITTPRALHSSHPYLYNPALGSHYKQRTTHSTPRRGLPGFFAPSSLHHPLFRSPACVW